MELGFVGLGAMGHGMAQVLVRAGHRVAVWNRTRERAEALAADGAAVAATAADAAHRGVVVTMLADAGAVEAVTGGAEGILAGLPKGGVHVSASAIGRDAAAGSGLAVLVAGRRRGRPRKACARGARAQGVRPGGGPDGSETR